MWLQIFLDTNQVGMAQLVLHGVTNNMYYQFFSKTNLISPPVGAWAMGEEQRGTKWCYYDPNSGTWTNDIWFTEIACTNPPNDFFRAAGATNEVSVSPSGLGTTAIRPDASGNGGTNSGFTVNLVNWTPITTNLVVYYAASGTAVYGVDYTNLPGCITNANGIVAGSIVINDYSSSASVPLSPLYRTNLGFDVVATFTLLPGEGYVVDRTNATVSIPIMDNFPSNTFSVVATNIPGIVDIGYFAPSNCLIVSMDWQYGSPYNFALLGTNGVLTNWSSVANLDGEVNIATAEVTTNGFTNGCTYFLWENNGEIGWVSADGTTDDTENRSGPFWSSVPTGTGNGVGDLCFDRTGLWGHELLVAEGDGNYGGVYRINSGRVVTPVATLPTPYTEGLLTVPNDQVTYGPWAGKLLTSDEVTQTIYSIDTNGAVQPWNIGVTGQKLLIIPRTNNLYCMDAFGNLNGYVLKVPKDIFASYVGDILAFQSPEQPGAGFPPALYIIHWNGTGFDTSPLLFNDLQVPPGTLERGAFAPFDMPPVQ